MLFARSGEYEPCGMFTTGHFELIIITILGIVIALKNTINKTKEEVKQIIKKCTIVMWILEVIMIAFKLCTGEVRNLNNYVPLYYCSLLLYAGLLSSFAKDKLNSYDGGRKSNIRIIYLSPRGKVLNYDLCKDLSTSLENCILICGHYEGIDERIIEE